MKGWSGSTQCCGQVVVTPQYQPYNMSADVIEAHCYGVGKWGQMILERTRSRTVVDKVKTFRPRRSALVTKLVFLFQFCNCRRPSWSKHLTLSTIVLLRIHSIIICPHLTCQLCVNQSELAIYSSLGRSYVSWLCRYRMEADRKVYQLQKAQKKHGAPGVKAKAKKVCLCVCVCVFVQLYVHCHN